MEAVSPHAEYLRTSQAIARVSAYLGCLGLPPDHAEARAKALLDAPALRVTLTEEDLTAAALAEVTSRFDAWLEYLCKNADEGSDSRRDLLAWLLRPVLAEHPDLFLRRGAIPEPVQLALRTAAQPAVPAELPAPMPAQSFGEAPAVFRTSFWRGLADQLGSVRRGMGAWIRGR